MAEAKKIALTNLADLRSDLGLTQDEMANAIKPMTRQTLGTIENGEFKDALFLRAVFERLRTAYQDRFADFDFVDDPDKADGYLVRYTSKSQSNSELATFDRQALEIMRLTTTCGRSIKGDCAMMHAHEPELSELYELLHGWFGKEVAEPPKARAANDAEHRPRRSDR
jgi:DNA-binding XRE family transcriptional regulator